MVTSSLNKLFIDQLENRVVVVRVGDNTPPASTAFYNAEPVVITILTLQRGLEKVLRTVCAAVIPTCRICPSQVVMDDFRQPPVLSIDGNPPVFKDGTLVRSFLYTESASSFSD
jgi:hypothetical protein